MPFFMSYEKIEKQIQSSLRNLSLQPCSLAHHQMNEDQDQEVIDCDENKYSSTATPSLVVHLKLRGVCRHCCVLFDTWKIANPDSIRDQEFIKQWGKKNASR